MDKTQKRWSFIVNILYFAVIIAAFYLFMKYAFSVVLPFIASFVISAFLQKPLKFITGKSAKIPYGTVSAILSVLVFAVFVGFLAMGGVKIANSVRDLISYFTARCSNLGDFFEVLKMTYLDLEIANMLPAEANNAVTSGIDSFSEYVVSGEIFKTLTDNISKFISPIGSAISKVPSIIVGFIISIIATCFMTSTFDDIKAFIVRQFSDENQNKLRKAKHIVISSVGKMIKAYASIIVITTGELFVGLGVLKLIGLYEGSHLLLLCFIIALIDIIPVLGTGTVMLPWSVYSFVTGNIGLGIGLLVIYALITVI